MEKGWPVDVAALGPATCGARLWRGPGSRHLTIIVKAVVELVHEGPARVVPGAELVTKDRHYLDSPGRSLAAASEIAPYLARCDVTLRGHAYAPSGQSVPAMTARLAVYRGSSSLDKKLYVVGDETDGARTPFPRMPLDYEHAYGGKSHPDNPVGRGHEKPPSPSLGSTAGPPSTAKPRVTKPNVVHPGDATKPIGFAPLSRFWGERARALGKLSRGEVDREEAEIPQGFDWRYLQAAPADQQIPYLVGDEWIVLDGMHPALARFSSQLPSLRGLSKAYTWAGGSGYSELGPIKLDLDTLSIDADRLLAAVLWRGSLVLDPQQRLEDLKVIVGVESAGASVVFPDVASLVPPVVATPAPAPAAPSGVPIETRQLSADEAARAASAKADPFLPAGATRGDPLADSVGRSPRAEHPDDAFGDTRTISPSDADRGKRDVLPFAGGAAPPAEDAPSSLPPSLPFAPPPSVAIIASPFAQPAAPAAPPPPAERDLSQTYVLPPRAPSAGAAVPFVPAPPGSSPMAQAGPLPPRAPESTDFGATVTLGPATRDELSEELAPFPLARPATAVVTSVPVRTSPQVPIVNRTPLTAATTPWQVTPPQDSLTVIVKGTFDLVQGGPARIRDEGNPLCGDVHVDDDRQKSLRYASDFAIQKPEADVVLVGTAYAPGGEAAYSRVAFRFGDAKRFERVLHVVGDRVWSGAGVARVPSDPAKFESMPLVFERAYGGPGYAANPVGRGHGGAAPLPNVELPDRPITGPGDTPPPACLGPIPAGWKQRFSKLGTYDATWLSTRWPYYPADFDWTYFQSAPAQQRTPHLRGDEPFEIGGVHAETAVLKGTLPGVRARAFAMTTAARGGELFEVALRLDTAAFDADALTVDLVWRGRFDVSDDEAPEIETLFVHLEPLAAPPVTLEEAKRLLLVALTPSEPEVPPLPEPPPEPLSPEAARAVRDAVVVLLAAPGGLEGVDAQGGDLGGLDFAGRALAGANFKDANLAGAKLAGADLTGAVLAGADLTDADLQSANLAGADLVAATLAGAVLDGANLDGADLSLVDADGASFKKVTGASTQFAGGSFSAARFDGAELVRADFTEARLGRAVFDDAVLPEVTLYYAIADRARFDRARLDEARCDDAKLSTCSFVGVAAASSVWEKATLSGSTFAGANLAGASFSRAACDKVEFSSVEASGAHFVRARLSGARFLKANLCEADFERADLTGVDFRGANLHGAETLKAKLAGAQFDLAIVTRSKL